MIFRLCCLLLRSRPRRLDYTYIHRPIPPNQATLTSCSKLKPLLAAKSSKNLPQIGKIKSGKADTQNRRADIKRKLLLKTMMSKDDQKQGESGNTASIHPPSSSQDTKLRQIGARCFSNGHRRVSPLGEDEGGGRIGGHQKTTGAGRGWVVITEVGSCLLELLLGFGGLVVPLLSSSRECHGRVGFPSQRPLRSKEIKKSGESRRWN